MADDDRDRHTHVRSSVREIEKLEQDKAQRRRYRVDQVLIEVVSGYRQASLFASTKRDLAWYATLGYAVANEGSPGGASHLAWQRVQPLTQRIRRWRPAREQLVYVIGYGLGAFDGGKLTSTELDELIDVLSRRGAVVIEKK